MHRKPEPFDPVNNSLLITTIDSIDVLPHFLTSPIAVATTKSLQSLTIVLVSPYFNPPGYPFTKSRRTSIRDVKGISRTERWEDVQKILTFVYVQATKVAQELGRILLNVDVLFDGGFKAGCASDIVVNQSFESQR